MSRCLAGEADAWAELVNRHRKGMIDLACRILPAADAEDVVAAVLVDLWERRKLARYEGRSSLGTWLGAVAINAALNARRAAAARPDTSPANPLPEAGSPPPAAASPEELRVALHESIAALPVATRAVVLLHYEQQLSLEQIGRLVGLSKSTVSRALQQAREEIRAAADRIARARWGTTLDALRSGVDLGQLDLDLRAACQKPGNIGQSRVSKVRPS